MATTLLITRPRAYSFLASQGSFLVFTTFIYVSSGLQNVQRKHNTPLHPHSEPRNPCPEQVFSPACPISLSTHSFLMLLPPCSKGQSHPSCICLLLVILLTTGTIAAVAITASRSLESLTEETDLFVSQILKSRTEAYSERLQAVRDKWQSLLL